jgi:hypothetical protein
MFLMEYESFKESLKTRWNEIHEDVISKNEDWHTAPEILAIKTYEEQIWFLFDYLTRRVEWLNIEVNLL